MGEMVAVIIIWFGGVIVGWAAHDQVNASLKKKSLKEFASMNRKDRTLDL